MKIVPYLMLAWVATLAFACNPTRIPNTISTTLKKYPFVEVYLPHQILQYNAINGFDHFTFEYSRLLGSFVLKGGAYDVNNKLLSGTKFKLKSNKNAAKAQLKNCWMGLLNLKKEKIGTGPNQVDPSKDYILKPIPYPKDKQFVSYEINESGMSPAIPALKGRIDPSPPAPRT